MTEDPLKFIDGCLPSTVAAIVLTISEWIQTYESVFVICYDIEMDLLVYSRYLGWDCGGVSSWNWLTVTVPQQNNEHFGTKYFFFG